MPELDYGNGAAPPTIGGVPLSAMAEKYGHQAPRTYGGRFYDGTPGRKLVCCPDCGFDCDALFGDHGGVCARKPGMRPRNSAT